MDGYEPLTQPTQTPKARKGFRIALLTATVSLAAFVSLSYTLAPVEFHETCAFWDQQWSELTAVKTATITWDSPSPILIKPSKDDPQDVESILSHLADEPPTPKLDAQIKPVFDRDELLTDPDNRVADDFKIDDDMKARVGFWFDIYTKYSSDERVIHNQKFPWIVYKIIDVAPIIYAAEPHHRWLRNVKADKLVQSEAKNIRAILIKISKTKNLAKLTPEQQAIADLLKSLPGKLQRNAAAAANEVRIQTGQRDFFTDGLQVSSQYLAEMDTIFQKAKIPTELTRLPLVESSFNHLATSKAGASGIWQFVGGTGRKFLIVDGPIDERRSPFKSTMAAARLLKENHLIMYHSWPLAITAYNHGPAGVKKAVRATGTRSIGAIVRRYNTKSFNFASCNYYAEFLAALYAEKYKDKIFSNIEFTAALEDDSIVVPKTIRTKQLLRVTGMSSDELTLHNPDLIKAFAVNASVPKGFRLHIPSSMKESLEAKLALARKGRLSAWNG